MQLSEGFSKKIEQVATKYNVEPEAFLLLAITVGGWLTEELLVTNRSSVLEYDDELFGATVREFMRKSVEVLEGA